MEASVQPGWMVPRQGPGHMSLVAWLCRAPGAGAVPEPSLADGELPRVPAERTGIKGATATQSVLQEVDEAGWEDSGAGAVALDEADLGVQRAGVRGVGVPPRAGKKLWG